MDKKKVRALIAGIAGLVIGMLFVFFGASNAFAGGSDSETLYTVTSEGIYLPAGETFQDNGHVNVRTNQGDRGIHFESLNNQPSGKWIGENFLPWEAFGFDPGTLCVSWVQLSQYNEHFGEGGQEPVGYGCSPKPEPSPTVTPTVTPTKTPEPTPEPTVTPTKTPEPTPEPTVTPTKTPEPSPTVTSIPKGSPEPTVNPTSKNTPVPVNVSNNTLAKTGIDFEKDYPGLLIFGVAFLIVGMVIIFYAIFSRKTSK